MHSLLAAFVLRGRWQAVLVTVAGALLAQLFLPLGYLSGAAVALVTLRMGWQHGLSVVMFSMIAVGVLRQLASPVMDSAGLGMLLTAALWLPIWVTAQSLRRTMMPGRSVILAALFGIMIVLGFSVGVEEPVTWWQETMSRIMMPAVETLPQAEQEQIQAGIGELALIMTGSSAMFMSLSLIISLFIARWWQARLYNPGGFGDEFRQLRLGKGAAMLLLLLLVAAGLSGNDFMAHNLPVVVLLPFLLQGLAVVHALVKQRNAHSGWLAGTYLLLFVTGPTALLLAFAGVVDNWFDFRLFFGPKRGADDS